ncbi:MAG: T9SS type B sorting domain-containing protein [Bacteroidetes bacterium]|nr:MAG: T9SS type B sorting domain-containing protein [Bacteroidota bacterium]
MLKKFFLTLALFIFNYLNVNASHLVGGEIHYDSLGNDMYRIVIELYRDCQNSSTQFDDPIEYTIFYPNGTIYWTRSVPLPTPEILPLNYDDPCVTPPDDICIERAIYIDIVTLPWNPEGYVISYQRCCWANNIQNMINPQDNGITLTTFIPGSQLVSVYNNSAHFTEYPPLVLCANNTLDFDHSALDIDGDSLVYSLCSPWLGGSITNVIPNPESAPPYFPITWETGFSATVPLGAGSTVSIDSETGAMQFTPNMLGNFVIGVCVEEWRDGVMINSTMRTFGYRVVACDVEIPLEVQLIGPPDLIEDCGFAGFIVSRTDTTESLTVQIFLSGDAENGIDYTYLPDTLILEQGVFSDTIGFTPLFDGLTEGTETVVFNIVIPNECNNTFDTTSTTVNIIDYVPLAIASLDSINVCAEGGEVAQIYCLAQNGVPPYTYLWEPDFGYPSNDTITVLPSSMEPNLNIYTVTVVDQCYKAIQSQPILVYNQCYLVVPNVITMNNDGQNDHFIIENLEDYDQVALVILNRWGNVIYSNDDYQNDWDGTLSNGKQVDEGVYFYKVSPESTKYEYHEESKTQFVLHGFFHVVK